MTNFELYYRNFERLPQRHQIYTKSQSTIREAFETIKTAYVEMSIAHSMIDPIFNIHFGNTFHHRNGKNQRQHIHKNTSKQYQYITYQIPRTS